MLQEFASIVGARTVAENIQILSFAAPRMAPLVRAGQFINIKVDDTKDPLLRRPFSVHDVEGSVLSVMFNVVGRGTAVLARKQKGEPIDLLGPLGKPFGVDSPSFEHAVLIAGGMGVAPMPLLSRALRMAGKQVTTFLGARTKSAAVVEGLDTLRLATDDGSAGFHGTVVALAREALAQVAPAKVKLFACGPTPMLRAVKQMALALDLQCEVSLEGAMACGFGICQGCPVETVGGPKKYLLMCKDGPTFDARSVVI